MALIIRANSGCFPPSLTGTNSEKECGRSGWRVVGKTFANAPFTGTAAHADGWLHHAGDIVLLSLARDDGNAARVKDFQLSLRYSEDRVNQVLKELERDGWLTMEREEDDRRMQKVHASDRIRLLLGKYQRFLLEIPTIESDVGQLREGLLQK